MKIIHTSDWHFGLRFYRFDRDDEHRFFIRQLAGIMEKEKPDALVVCGDIFDNAAPPATVQTAFVDAVLALHGASPSTIIVITSGNHDSGTRLEVTKRLWKFFGVYVCGSCRREEDGTFDPSQFIVPIKGCGYIIAAPYFHSSNYPAAVQGLERNERKRRFYQTLADAVNALNTENLPVVMMAHLAVSGCDLQGHEDRLVGSMEYEAAADLGSGYDYLALGHIHKPQNIDGGSGVIRYSGSPIPLSFAEDYKHGITLVEIPSQGDPVHLWEIPIVPLRSLKSIPSEGADLETALSCLNELDSSDNSCIRLVVDQEGILPADAEDRANALTQGKQCRFCEVHKVSRLKGNVTKDGMPHDMEIEDVMRLQPIDIANRYFERTYGNPLNDELSALLMQAIQLTNEEDKL